MIKKVDKGEAERNLVAKGFKCEVDSHHKFYYLELDDGRQPGIKTFFSHSKKHRDITGDILLSIKKQLKLDDISDAVKLLQCPMSRKDYISILKEKGLLSLV